MIGLSCEQQHLSWLMTAARQARSNAGECVLVVVTAWGQVELGSLLTLRATCKRLCKDITGHFPRGILLKALSRPGRQQVPSCSAP